MVIFLTLYSYPDGNEDYEMVQITLTAIVASISGITLALAEDALSVTAASPWTALSHLQGKLCQKLDLLGLAKVVVHRYEPVTF